MALQITKTDNKGTKTDYFRIVAMAQVYVGDAPMWHVNLAGYTDGTFRESEKESGNDMIVSSAEVLLPLCDIENYSRSLAYTAIKALPDWSESLDC